MRCPQQMPSQPEAVEIWPKLRSLQVIALVRATGLNVECRRLKCVTHQAKELTSRGKFCGQGDLQPLYDAGLPGPSLSQGCTTVSASVPGV